MRYLCSVIFCFLLWNSLGYAQNDSLGLASGLTSQTAKIDELLGKLHISYMLFQTPNFKVRIGDFRNKSEALKTKAQIASKYPNAFIVKDNIRYPEIFPESIEQTEEQ